MRKFLFWVTSIISTCLECLKQMPFLKMSSMKRAKICKQSVKTFGIPQLFPEIDPREKNAGNSVLAYSACL